MIPQPAGPGVRNSFVFSSKIRSDEWGEYALEKAPVNYTISNKNKTLIKLSHTYIFVYFSSC